MKTPSIPVSVDRERAKAVVAWFTHLVCALQHGHLAEARHAHRELRWLNVHVQIGPDAPSAAKEVANGR